MSVNFSSREFNQDVSSAKKAALQAPVFITDRGRPSHVLLSIEEYQRLTHTLPTIVELLAMQADIEFEPQTITAPLWQEAELL